MIKIECKICNKHNYGGTRKTTEYLVIHYTSNNGDTAKNNADYFNREQLKNPASAHYFVDENEIWNSVPENSIAYHCGAKTYKHKSCRNLNSIGIEICMNDKSGGIRYKSIENAIPLVQQLMNKYQIPIQNVVRHYDVTGKDCPAPMVKDEMLWENFKNKLCEDIKMKVYKYIPDMPDYAQDTFTRLFKVGVISTDSSGAIAVEHSSIQPMVYIDRLTGGQIEKLPELFNLLQNK